MTSSQGYDQAPPGRDRVGALAGLASVAAFVAGQYVAPALVWPEEQVGGVQLSFYADDRGRLLAQAVLLGVAAALFLRFLAGLRPAAVAAGAVAAGLVLLQAAVLAALVSLRASELAVQAQGSAWAARALFSLEEAVGNAALFPFAVFLAAAALGHAGTLPRWLGWAGSALAVLVALLAVGATADLDLDPAGPLVFLASSAWVAVLAFATGWPLPSVVGRRAETIG
jgi:hypothetical protein